MEPLELLMPLVEKYKSKGKTFGGNDMKIFTNELLRLIKIEQFSKNVENILFEAPPELSMNVFGLYTLSDNTINNDMVESFLNSDSARENRNSSFSIRLIYLWLFFYEKGMGSNANTNNVFICMARKAKNKKNVLLKNVVDLVRKQVLIKISPNNPIYPWDQIQIKDWLNIKDLFIEATFGSNFEDSKRQIKKNVYMWLLSSGYDLVIDVEKYPEFKKFINPEKSEPALIQQPENKQVEIEKATGIPSIPTPIAVSSKSNEPNSTEIKTWKYHLKQLESMIARLESGNSNKSTEILELTSQNQKLLSQNDKLTQEKTQLEDEISEIRKDLATKDSELENAHAKIKELNEKAANLLEHIRIINKDKSKIPEEMTNRLISRLSPDYSEFVKISVDTIDAEMGKIIYFQLEDVYKTLVKSGIKLKEQ